MDHRITNKDAKEIWFGPVNRCIYCGCDRPPLTDEHIIADGLGGNLILAAASCSDCAKIINRAETQVLRSTFRHARGALGLRSKKKRRPEDTVSTAPIGIGDGGSEMPLMEVPFNDMLPCMIPLFVTSGPPTLIRPHPEPNEVRLCHVVPPDFADRRAPLAGDGKAISVQIDGVNLGLLAQVIAKTAHAYAVSQLGPDAFEPLLLDLILSEEEIPHLDTALISSKPPTEGRFLSLHDIRLGRTRSYNLQDKALYHVCQLRLFSCWDTPTFLIVVGRAKE